MRARTTVVGQLRDAIEMLVAGPCGCVLGDLELPDAWPLMSSAWYAELARRQIPVVVVSGSRRDVEVIRARHPDLPFGFAKEDLDGPFLRLFIDAAVRRQTILAVEQDCESGEPVRVPRLARPWSLT
jgi:hypothetical protein